jgi:hypothetical protein
MMNMDHDKNCYFVHQNILAPLLGFESFLILSVASWWVGSHSNMTSFDVRLVNGASITLL